MLRVAKMTSALAVIAGGNAIGHPLSTSRELTINVPVPSFVLICWTAIIKDVYVSAASSC